MEIDRRWRAWPAPTCAAAAVIERNVVRDGDGARPARRGPFDAIVLSGSVSSVPQALLEQLRPGGRLLAIVGQEPVMRAVRITRQPQGGYTTVELFDTVAPALDGFAPPTRFTF
jgi:protein-L-isoaspartate(D-aspartate) O-methyltransferase